MFRLETRCKKNKERVSTLREESEPTMMMMILLCCQKAERSDENG
jgi:hypothetical protein